MPRRLRCRQSLDAELAQSLEQRLERQADDRRPVAVDAVEELNAGRKNELDEAIDAGSSAPE